MDAETWLTALAQSALPKNVRRDYKGLVELVRRSLAQSALPKNVRRCCRRAKQDLRSCPRTKRSSKKRQTGPVICRYLVLPPARTKRSSKKRQTDGGFLRHPLFAALAQSALPKNVRRHYDHEWAGVRLAHSHKALFQKTSDGCATILACRSAPLAQSALPKNVRREMVREGGKVKIVSHKALFQKTSDGSQTKFWRIASIPRTKRSSKKRQTASQPIGISVSGARTKRSSKKRQTAPSLGE